MLKNLKRSLISCLLLLVICGLIYPLIGTGISQALFKFQANGSEIKQGSLLIEQNWKGPKWFQGRNDGSVLTLGPDKVLVSGTNQPGPRSKQLTQSVEARAQQLIKDGILPKNDLVTTSGSLLDPDISLQDARAQVMAISRYRHIKPEELYALIQKLTVQRQFGFLGEPYVNVLQLNIALSKLGNN